MALLKPDAATPSPPDAKAKPPAASNVYLLRRFWPYARADWRWLVGGLTAVPLMSLTGLVQPLLLKEAIDGPIAQALCLCARSEWAAAPANVPSDGGGLGGRSTIEYSIGQVFSERRCVDGRPAITRAAHASFGAM